MSQRPQAINQDYLVSWNNKQARHCCGGAELHAGVALAAADRPAGRAAAQGRKMTLAEVVDAAEDAATADLRGDKMLPLGAEDHRHAPRADLADAVAKLREWVARRLTPLRQGPRRPLRPGDAVGSWTHGTRRCRARSSSRRWATRSSSATTSTFARPAELLPRRRPRPPRLGVGGRLVRASRRTCGRSEAEEGARQVAREVLRRRQAVALPRRRCCLAARGAGGGPGEALRGPDAEGLRRHGPAGVLRRAAVPAAGAVTPADDPVAEPADAAAGGGGDVAPGAVARLNVTDRACVSSLSANSG